MVPNHCRFIKIRIQLKGSALTLRLDQIVWTTVKLEKLGERLEKLDSPPGANDLELRETLASQLTDQLGNLQNWYAENLTS